MRITLFKGLAVAVFAAATAVGCGGGSNGSPTTPTSPTNPTTPSNSVTITIGSDGRVTPNAVTIPRGGLVIMVNNHNLAHDMSSDPHPEHTQCPELNQWGFLQPGQSRPSGNLNVARTCGFHDHNRDTDPNLRGTITIQ